MILLIILKMANRFALHSNTNTPNKTNTFLFKIHFKNILIFLFISLFLNSQEQKQINIVVQGTGWQFLIYEHFSVTPSEILINNNGAIQTCTNAKGCDCPQTSVEVYFSSLLTTCYQIFSK